MTIMKQTLAPLGVLAIALSQLGATDCGQVLRDPGFDLWCGNELCAWKIERGQIARVPTWNDGDPGVELVGADAAIEQLSPVASSDGHCLEFSMIANVDDAAELVLNVDVFGDGSVEHSERIPTAHWKPLSYKLSIAPVAYDSIRFELAKRGAGHAVVAQLQAKITTGCDGLTEIVPAPAPLGAPCATPAQCASSRCGAGTAFAHVCVGCDDQPGECAASDVCGLGAPTSPVRPAPHACVARGARVLGERCGEDAVCAAGLVCTGGACSTCRDTDKPCAGGERCGAAWEPAAFGPFVCSPNQHLRARGEPCASHADCASSTCSGPARLQCDDGRACATAAECPFTNLKNGPCNTVGVQGGSCE